MPEKTQPPSHPPQNLTSLALQLDRCPPQQQRQILSAIFTRHSIGRTQARPLAAIFNKAFQRGMLNELAAWPCADDAVRRIAASEQAIYMEKVDDAAYRLSHSRKSTQRDQGRKWRQILAESILMQDAATLRMQQPLIAIANNASNLATIAPTRSTLPAQAAWMGVLHTKPGHQVIDLFNDQAEWTRVLQDTSPAATPATPQASGAESVPQDIETQTALARTRGESNRHTPPRAVSIQLQPRASAADGITLSSVLNNFMAQQGAPNTHRACTIVANTAHTRPPSTTRQPHPGR